MVISDYVRQNLCATKSSKQIQKGNALFRPLFTADEQYSIDELIPSVWLLECAAGGRSFSELRCVSLIKEFAGRLVHQTSHEGFRDLIDWWITCRLGGEPMYCVAPNSFAKSGLDSETIERLRSMVVRRGLNGPEPILEWVERRRNFDQHVQSLSTMLGEWRNKRGIQNVGHLINHLEVLVSEAIEYLSNGMEPPTALTPSEIDRLLKVTEIQQGSNTFRQWSRNLTGASKAMSAAIELLPDLQPFDLDGLRVDKLGNGRLKHLSEDFRTAASVLLRKILSSAPERTPDLAEIFEALALDEIDQQSLGKLAVLAEATNDASIDFATLRDLTRIRADVPILRRSGEDVEFLEMYLDAGLLEDARGEIDRLRDNQRQSQQTQFVRRQTERFAANLAKLDDLEIDTGDIRQSLEQITSSFLDLDSQRFKSELASLELRVCDETYEALRNLSSSLIQNYYSLNVDSNNPRSAILTDRQSSFDSLDLPSRLAFIEEVREDCSTILEERHQEIRNIVPQLQMYLREDEQDEPINSIVSRFTELTFEADEGRAIMQLREDALKLLKDLDARKVTMWRAKDGEPALVEHIVRFIVERTGIQPLDIKRFYVSLKTKRFVMLGGLLGTGKSTLARLFCDAMNSTSANGRFLRVAVRPDWTEQGDVLGRVDPTRNVFVPGWLASLLKRCNSDPTKAHFCLLDEMNLAPMDQYFAEILSALEEEPFSVDERPLVSLYPEGMDINNQSDWPPYLPLPSNLYFIGTVTIDQPSNVLSSRVVDRGNFIQLAGDIGRQHHSTSFDYSEPRWTVEAPDWERFMSRIPTSKYHDTLVDIGNLIEDLRMGVGFRTHVEIERYLTNAQGILSDDEAVDTAILQRIIPKLKGSLSVSHDALLDLWSEFQKLGLLMSAAVIRFWLDGPASDADQFSGLDPYLSIVTSRIDHQTERTDGTSHVTKPEEIHENDPPDDPLPWQDQFLNGESIPKRQDDFLRAMVVWMQMTPSARELVRAGITSDEICRFIRRRFPSADSEQTLRRVRVIVSEENRGETPKPKLCFVPRNKDGRLTEVLTEMQRDESLHPEGWRRRALRSAPENLQPSAVLGYLISWLVEDVEGSGLLSYGVDLSDLGSVARDLGFVKEDRPLKTLVQEILDRSTDFTQRLELKIEPTQVSLKWRY